MDIVEDESITTANAAAGKLFVNTHHPNNQTVDSSRSTLSLMMAMRMSTNASNLSTERRPFSSSDQNSSHNTMFELSSAEFRDSRHDSPKEDQTLQQQEDGDAMMTSEDTTLQNAANRSSGFILPPPPIRTSLAPPSSLPSGVPTSATTEGDRANGTGRNAAGENGNSFHREEKVCLAPRFGSTPPQNAEGGEPSRQGPQDHDLNSEHLFSISGSMSSEYLDHQHRNPDHQQEYIGLHERRGALGINSPTSTTARDFLREVDGPAIPSMHDSSQGEGIVRTRNTPVQSYGTPPLPHHSNDGASQRPPFHLQSRINTTPPSSSSHPTSTSPPPPPLSAFYKTSSHPTLMREHQTNPMGSSPSSTSYNIPGVGSFCDSSWNGGREKPVISRCFAWSQDSQDERRITKRPRMVTENNVLHVALGSSPHSTDTNGSIMSPTSAIEIVRNTGDPTSREGGQIYTDEHKSELKAAATSAFSRPTANDTYGIKHDEIAETSQKDSSSSPPTKVHWEEKVENSSELMSHAVAPQVLFGNNSAMSSTMRNDNEDVTMGDGEQQHELRQPLTDSNLIPPPITAAHSASHYSFESL